MFATDSLSSVCGVRDIGGGLSGCCALSISLCVRVISCVAIWLDESIITASWNSFIASLSLPWSRKT